MTMSRQCLVSRKLIRENLGKITCTSIQITGPHANVVEHKKVAFVPFVNSQISPSMFAV